jgi:hypothetical protein
MKEIAKIYLIFYACMMLLIWFLNWADSKFLWITFLIAVIAIVIWLSSGGDGNDPGGAGSTYN